MSTADTSKMPNSLEEHWMPFTSNKDFKANPRLITEAKGVYLKNHQGQTQIDASSGLFCNPLGHGRQEIIEAIVVALSGACPERTMAGWGRRLRIAIKGTSPKDGSGFIWHMFHARPGAGASSGGDGWHNSGEWHSAGGLKFGSVEVAEVRFPLFFAKHEFRANSSGNGQFIGGAGCDLEFTLETEEDAVVNTAGDGVRYGPCGMMGGQPGQPHKYGLREPNSRLRVLGSKEEGVPVAAGSVFEIHSAGGGGWGPPEKRDAKARRRDRRDGIYTRRLS